LEFSNYNFNMIVFPFNFFSKAKKF
jgi:hypothetical protein